MENTTIQSQSLKKGWELRDVIMMGVIGVVFAAIYLVSTTLWIALQTALTPFGLAAFAVEIVYGIWFMAGSLAAFILRKPGTAFTAEFLAAIIEMFMGNFGGPLVVLFGAIQGAGNEAGFAVFRYRRFGLPAMCMSAILAAVFSFVTEVFTGSVELLSPGFVLAKLGLRIASAIAFTGVVCWLCGKALVRTGVLKSYPAGGDAKPAAILDD
ncbi:MAG: ECF transporter S component [Clostridiales Family XIII bacterium]|jgi:energy-coupling factor transport system substrate-specific component|nr:ECF transporter S component [Clostridiales Family XIII bacterium]